jgi:tetratricopeptide (TPR) repeat protein
VLLRGHRQHPGDFWICHNLGVYYYKMNPPRLDEALRFFTAALALRSRSAPVHNNLGIVLMYKGRLDQAIDSFQEALRIEPDYAYAHCNLGIALTEKGEPDRALIAIRAALDRQKDFPAAYLSLGKALAKQGQRREALAAYREAVRLDRNFAHAHFHLGNALEDEGKFDEAVASYKEAIRCDKDYAEAYANLGKVLLDDKKDPAGALSYFRQALRVNPGLAFAHCQIGNAHLDRGEADRAVTAFRQAVHFQEDFPEAHIGLGLALEAQGQFAEALAAFERGDALGSKRPGWNYPSGQLVVRCRRLLELDRQRPAVLRGEIKPAAGDWIELARLCLKYKRLNAAAAHFYQEAFAARPESAEQRKPYQRYNAACAAARAAAGQGDDAAGLAAGERSRWRSQALEWLQAELAYWGKQLDRDTPEVRAQVGEVLRHWQQDADLAGLRDPAALAQLPAPEREACRQFWAAAAALRQRAGPN